MQDLIANIGFIFSIKIMSSKDKPVIIPASLGCLYITEDTDKIDFDNCINKSDIAMVSVKDKIVSCLNLYGESLINNVTVFGDNAFKELMKAK